MTWILKKMYTGNSFKIGCGSNFKQTSGLLNEDSISAWQQNYYSEPRIQACLYAETAPSPNLGRGQQEGWKTTTSPDEGDRFRA